MAVPSPTAHGWRSGARTLDLFPQIRAIVDRIPADLFGGCPLAKAFVTAHLAMARELKTYVEVGVYRGRSFFPLAHVCRKLGGRAFGVDAYDAAVAAERETDPAIASAVEEFRNALDFAQVLEDVNRLREDLGVADATEILRMRSRDAAAVLAERAVAIDLLHLDGNHDTAEVMADVLAYVPLVRAGGFVVLDDVDWMSVKPAARWLTRTCERVFDNGQFAIFRKPGAGAPLSTLEARRLRILHDMAANLERGSAARHGTPAGVRLPVVSVILFAYNQAPFVAEAIEGILAQQGPFRIELVVGEDLSTDGTADAIRAHLDALPAPWVTVVWPESATTLGIAKNLERSLRACTGRYIAICEGDDSWIESDKLRVQTAFMEAHPECALSFTDIEILNGDTGEITAWVPTYPIGTHHPLTTSDLIRENFIGNLSCCMYDRRHLRHVPAALFDLPLADWMLNIYWSRFGGIGHVPGVKSVYRRHAAGLWSGKTAAERTTLLARYVRRYNRFLGFEFDREFARHELASDLGPPAPDDLAILDDVFPHPLSPFRLQEFRSYLEALPRVRLHATGLSVHVLGPDTLDNVIAAYKRAHPEHAERLVRYPGPLPISAKLGYTVFLHNTHRHVDAFERHGMPFVFTLYPGGGFQLDDERSDAKLRRVTGSPCFRKVIVTQQLTRDYLTAKGFCTPDQILSVFGLVVPLGSTTVEMADKRRFGLDKDTLDICFVAHRYMPRGVDKGYDVFVDVAHALARARADVRFHVVGQFGPRDIDVSAIGDRVTFYGPRPADWFDEFYKDKDILLSPNVPFKLMAGAFDGFPTGTCVEAALRRTAVFASDVLGMNTHFTDGEDLVIVPPAPAAIVDAIQRYAADPDELAALADRGRRRARELYGYEAQIAPRLALLRTELAAAAPVRVPRRAPAAQDGVGEPTLTVRLAWWSWRATPAWLRAGLRRGIKELRAHGAVFRTIRQACPEPVARVYRQLRAREARR